MHTITVGINGFGRIGRLAFRLAFHHPDLRIAGINDLTDIHQLAYLLKYDSVHGKFDKSVEVSGQQLIVDGEEIRVTSEENPIDLNWNAIGVDTVLECSGRFKTKESAGAHLKAGAEQVVVSAPSKSIPMFVMGVNHNEVKPEDDIVSNASCTTNCLAALAKVVDEQFEIVEGLMTTVHAATSSQSTVDSASKKNYRIGRNALNNIIPTTTGAADAVTHILPHLHGKLTGMAFRVPTTNVSVVDLTLRTKKETTLPELKSALKEASENELKGVLGYTEGQPVSSDFIGETTTCVFDADASIALNNNFFKLVAWYDNEYGYTQKLIELALHVASLK